MNKKIENAMRPPTIATVRPPHASQYRGRSASETSEHEHAAKSSQRTLPPTNGAQVGSLCATNSFRLKNPAAAKTTPLTTVFALDAAAEPVSGARNTTPTPARVIRSVNILPYNTRTFPQHFTCTSRINGFAGGNSTPPCAVFAETATAAFGLGFGGGPDPAEVFLMVLLCRSGPGAGLADGSKEFLLEQSESELLELEVLEPEEPSESELEEQDELELAIETGVLFP